MKSKGLNTQTGLELPKDLRHLPSTVAELVPLYRDCIVRFDAAVHARDFEATNRIGGEAHDIIERAFSLPRFADRRTARGYHYCFMDVARVFQWLTRAAVGAVPLFGQQGDFEAYLSITRVRFKVDGLCSIGVSAYGGRVLGFSIHAVEWDRPFFSETGYRSFLCSSLEVGERTDDVKLWCLGHLRYHWNGEGGRATKYVLPRIRKIAPPPPPDPVDEDEDVFLECSACGDDLQQMDEYGECSVDGAVFCPPCYAKHQDSCGECLEPAEACEDDGRTDIGNGYIETPRVQPSQLSLF